MRRRLVDMEPWKLMALGYVIGAATMGVFAGIVTLLLRHG
jgi:hypothetical protein